MVFDAVPARLAGIPVVAAFGAVFPGVLADAAGLFGAPALVAGCLVAVFVAAAFFTASRMAAELFTAEFSLVVALAALGLRPLALTFAGSLADAALLAARFLGAASSFAMMGMLRFASSGSRLNAF